MGKPTDIEVLEVTADWEESPYRTPLKFGGKVSTHSRNLHISARVRTRDGREATGHGWMPLGNVWGWPSDVVTGDEQIASGLELFRRAAAAAQDYDQAGHPIDIALDLEPVWLDLAEQVRVDQKLGESMPKLFVLVICSPIDAALHDAYGKALGVNVYNAYGAEFMNHDLSRYLTPAFAGEYLDRYTRREPAERLPLYHLVGALDPLTPGDVSKPIGDGLPEHLIEWIKFDDLSHLKIKLNGDDLDWDIDRVVAIEAAASEAMADLGRNDWAYSADFNERAQGVDYVLGFLKGVKERAPRAYDRIAYIEQPTARDLRAHPENKMHRAAELKPVVIDESLVDLESYELAREQGYSGVALKTCKGHSHALLMAAMALKEQRFLCVQDLTCPGFSFLHSAGLAARVPTVTAIEGNARQFCPAANTEWAKEYPEVFKPHGGTIETGVLTKPGLGH